jgi:transcription initiation factor TFIIIB Brf1 subunit/transcription initiation factor TFIIB
MIPKFVKYKPTKKHSNQFKVCVADDCTGNIMQKKSMKLGAKFVCQDCGCVWSNSAMNKLAGPRDEKHCRVAYKEGSCQHNWDVVDKTIEPNEL